MPIYNELALGMLKERYEQIINDYINGNDTVDVFRARIFGLGYRGMELTREVNEATIAKEGKRTKPHVEYKVMVFERDGTIATVRFTDEATANDAVEILRQQPNVRLACRVFV